MMDLQIEIIDSHLHICFPINLSVYLFRFPFPHFCFFPLPFSFPFIFFFYILHTFIPRFRRRLPRREGLVPGRGPARPRWLQQSPPTCRVWLLQHGAAMSRVAILLCQNGYYNSSIKVLSMVLSKIRLGGRENFQFFQNPYFFCIIFPTFFPKK